MLLAVPELLPRVVALLRLGSPPPGLWSHLLAQLPTAPAAMGSTAEWVESEPGWEALGEASPAPHVVVVLSPEQIPPAMRELIAANLAVLFPGLNLPPPL